MNLTAIIKEAKDIANITITYKRGTYLCEMDGMCKGYQLIVNGFETKIYLAKLDQNWSSSEWYAAYDMTDGDDRELQDKMFCHLQTYTLREAKEVIYRLMLRACDNIGYLIDSENTADTEESRLLRELYFAKIDGAGDQWAIEKELDAYYEQQKLQHIKETCEDSSIPADYKIAYCIGAYLAKKPTENAAKDFIKACAIKAMSKHTTGTMRNDHFTLFLNNKNTDAKMSIHQTTGKRLFYDMVRFAKQFNSDLLRVTFERGLK